MSTPPPPPEGTPVPGYGPPSGYGPQPGQPGQPGWGPPPGQPGWSPPAGQPGWGPPPGWSPGPAQTSTKAVIALILAIAAYTPVVPFVGAVVALFLAASARRDIQASGGRQTGLGLCTAATVLSIVHLVLIGLLVVLVIGLFALPFSFS